MERRQSAPAHFRWATAVGQNVYVVSQTGHAIVVYDADTFEEVARIESKTPSAVFNMGIRTHEAGL